MRKFTIALLDEAVQMRAEGIGLMEIQHTLGVSYSYLTHILQGSAHSKIWRSLKRRPLIVCLRALRAKMQRRIDKVDRMLSELSSKG
jgi:hypothetical protein